MIRHCPLKHHLSVSSLTFTDTVAFSTFSCHLVASAFTIDINLRSMIACCNAAYSCLDKCFYVFDGTEYLVFQ